MSNLIDTVTGKATVAALAALGVIGAYLAAALLGIETAVTALEAGFLIVLGYLFGRTKPEAS